MKYQPSTKHFTALTAVFAVLLALTPAASAPHEGEEFRLGQPDGSSVRVLVWGDEFYQTVESPDGFTLIRDRDGWICYAELSADGSEYVSTGVRYTDRSRAPGSRKGLRINQKSYMEKHRKNREAAGYNEDEMVPRGARRGQAGLGKPLAPAEGEQPLQGGVSGLAILIDFPDQASNITTAAMTDFFNRKGGVNGNTASGSVRDWFYDASNGSLNYTNKVAPFIKAPENKGRYDTGTGYGNVRVLLEAILAELQRRVTNNTDGYGDLLCGISTEGTGTTQSIMATNVYYAGSPAAGWANGLWPHQGTYSGGNRDITIPAGRCGAGTAARTVRIARYQLSSLGTGSAPPSIGTTVHENGHMIMRWPDLYNYDATVTNVVASYCVMSSSNGGNPQQPNPHFRNLAGWINVTDITSMNAVLTHTTNIAQTAANPDISMTPDAYIFRRSAQEFYFIEARRRVGRSSNIPGEGLLVWHVHTQGVNTALNATRNWPLVKLVQANNPSSTLNTNTIANFPVAPTANAPFRAGGGSNNTAFHGTTAPPARYYDGTLSTMRITEVSALGATMSFRIGSATSGPATYLLDVANGSTGGGLYRADTTVRIGALPTMNSGSRGFVRWTTDALTPALPAPANIYACTTTVRTVARSATVTANYGRLFAIPGSVEADTVGFASGVTSNAQTGATGGRVGRFTGVGSYAEYAVNVTAAGSYQLSYSVLALTGTASGRFALRDITNNVVLDTIVLPVITGTAALRTVTGKAATLRAGRAVWRLEAIAMSGSNISIDVITAQPEVVAPATYALTVQNGTGGGNYEAGTVVTIRSTPTNATGQGFVRWSSATLTPANVYACTTTVTMGTAAATVTANYGRVFAIPGSVEVDTAGFASGVTSNAQTGATGGRLGRFTGAGSYAEYAVNVTAAGNYQLSYGILALTGTASGRFTLRDITNNVALDTIALPAVAGTAALQTVTGKVAALRAGRAVWRLEAVAMSGANISMDVFTVLPEVVAPPTYALTVRNGTGSGDYEAGEVVTVGALAANSDGLAFVRWSSATLTPAEVYACTTTVTTGAAAATVTANYGRINMLPGTVEADTAGYLGGITGNNNNNGATGGRVARATAAGQFAEYAVNVADTGRYKLSYRVAVSTSAAAVLPGSFVLIDLTNNAVLDTIAIPVSATAGLETVEGKILNLKAGTALWRLEALTLGGANNINMDWFAVEKYMETVQTVKGMPVSPVAYGISIMPSGNIRFSIPEAGRVSLKMYDVKGRMVATLCDGMRNPGVHSVSIASVQPSQGIYIIRMRCDGYSKDVKVNYRR